MQSRSCCCHLTPACATRWPQAARTHRRRRHGRGPGGASGGEAAAHRIRVPRLFRVHHVSSCPCISFSLFLACGFDLGGARANACMQHAIALRCFAPRHAPHRPPNMACPRLSVSPGGLPHARPRSHPASPDYSAELAKLSEQHGADYVVTEADIKAATAAAMAAALGGRR